MILKLQNLLEIMKHASRFDPERLQAYKVVNNSV